MKIPILIVDVKVQFIRNRKKTFKVFSGLVTKGNDFETRKKFIRKKRLGEMKEGVDEIIEIKVIKQVGETSVLNN